MSIISVVIFLTSHIEDMQVISSEHIKNFFYGVGLNIVSVNLIFWMMV
jgi:hypothetical protein